MPFGQVVIGPPGSGKTTYCKGLLEFLSGVGRRVAVVNLDPANDQLPYACAVDIRELITLQEVADKLDLGPNGGLVYCMEYLEKNVDWLIEKLQSIRDCYILFDCPGQVELFTHHTAIHNLTRKLTMELDFRLCAVHLIDAHYCTDAPTFISVLLLALSVMLKLELPYVSVLSKIDLMRQYGQLEFGLDFYTDVLNLDYILAALRRDETRFGVKWAKLNQVLADIVSEFSLVSFCTLNIQEKESVAAVIAYVDRANGYVFGGDEGLDLSVLQAAGTEWDWNAERIGEND